MKEYFKQLNINLPSLGIALVLSIAFIALSVQASTTISTNISTDGTLTVNGNTTLGDAATDTITATAVFAALTMQDGKGLVLGSSASDITGSAGMIYYDSTNKVIRMHDGSEWFTVGTSTGGLSLNGAQVRLSNLGYRQQYGTTTSQGNSQMTIEATSTTAIPLVLVGYTGQTADTFQVVGSGGIASTTLFYIDSNGGMVASASSTVDSTLTVSGNLTASSSLLVSGDITVSSGARIGEGSVPGNLTALANDTLFVEGAAEIDGVSYLDGGVLSNASSTVNSTLTVSGIFHASSTALFGGAVYATGGTLGVGATTSPSQEIGVIGDALFSSAATTTISAESTDANQGGCIELEGTDGNTYRIYIAATSSSSVDFRSLVVETGVCQTP